MYKYFLLFLSISLQLQSQVNTQLLSNHWTEVKRRMVDGSRDLAEANLKFHQWRLINNKLCEDYDPFIITSDKCMDYKIEKNFIRTSLESGYEIEKLEGDSLIVRQKIKGIEANDKLKKMWFVRSSISKSEYIAKTKNDSIVVATQYFTPTISKNFGFEITSKFNEMEYYPNFEITGNIIISPKKKKIDFVLEGDNDNTTKNTKYLEVIKSIIENSFPFWGLSDFKNFEKIYIPYSMKFKSGTGERRYNLNLIYFKDRLKNINPGKEIIRQDWQLSNQNFDKGLKAFEKQKYDQAIVFFNKAYELDNVNIDSLYNIVAIYSSKNDLKNECTTLKKLKDLEQTDATKMFNEKCLKINL